MSSTAKKISGLYGIADSEWNPFETYTELAEKFLRGGAKVLQLRMKGKPKNEVYSAARDIAKLKSRFNFLFIVNDHADIAAELGADGVHVGMNDYAVEDIKDRYGDKLIVGYSSHSIEEALKAAASADYIAFGAIFPTKTKGPGHPVQGISKLKEVVSLVNVPVVAIGGIGRGNFEDVLRTGVSSIAMISALVGGKDVEGETRFFADSFIRARGVL